MCIFDIFHIYTVYILLWVDIFTRKFWVAIDKYTLYIWYVCVHRYIWFQTYNIFLFLHGVMLVYSDVSV